MAHIFAKIGWPVHQLDGGYKEYRRFITQQIDQHSQTLSFQVICGPTGSGKSRLLQTLAAQGAQVLDLEKLAAHRGSVLGHLPTESQPTQKMFETIWGTIILAYCNGKGTTDDPYFIVFTNPNLLKVLFSGIGSRS